MNDADQKTTGGRAMLFFVALVLTLVTGCATVGPDHVPPQTVTALNWGAELKGGLTAEAADIHRLTKWWESFEDPLLSTLVERAIAENLDLKSAKSRVRQARANRGITDADRYPTVDGSGAYTRSRTSSNTGGGDTASMYTAGLDAAWEIDLFGGVRRSIEAADADLAASQEDLRDVMVSLVAEVGLDYVELRNYQRRLAVALENLKTQEETHDITRWRAQAGLATDLAVQQARYNLESTRSQIPTLHTGIEEAIHNLAILVGSQPESTRSGILAELREDKPIPTPPVETAVGIPADILRQRPDIRKAERELAAQTARIGEAIAELYPKFSLKGAIGLDARIFGDLFTAGSRSHSIGPGLSFPIFNAGSIRQNIEVQSALQEQKLLAYEQSVLSALAEVENALVSHGQELERRKSLQAAAEAAGQAAGLAQDQYTAGLIGFEEVLEAQRSLLSFQSQLAESEATVSANLIRLYKALGGGWAPLEPARSEATPSSPDAIE